MSFRILKVKQQGFTDSFKFVPQYEWTSGHWKHFDNPSSMGYSTHSGYPALYKQRVTTTSGADIKIGSESLYVDMDMPQAYRSVVMFDTIEQAQNFLAFQESPYQESNGNTVVWPVERKENHNVTDA